jgi:hypothetical protein
MAQPFVSTLTSMVFLYLQCIRQSMYMSSVYSSVCNIYTCLQCIYQYVCIYILTHTHISMYIYIYIYICIYLSISPQYICICIGAKFSSSSHSSHSGLYKYLFTVVINEIQMLSSQFNFTHTFLNSFVELVLSSWSDAPLTSLGELPSICRID